MKLNGKVALITGGGSGIGAATAERFVAEGAKVCITGRRQEMLDKVANSLPKGSVITCAGDVSVQKNAERMVFTAVKFGGKLDILVNSAGGGGVFAGVVDMSMETWQTDIGINLTAPFMMMKFAIPHMIKAGGGSIINISSLAGVRATKNSPSYCSAKAGLVMLTKQVALDYGPVKIRCNVICPGATRTPMLGTGINHMKDMIHTDFETAFSIFTADTPLRRAAEPGEIASVCNFLASDDSSFMTGATLVVDGGAHILDVSGIGIEYTAKFMAKS